MQYEIVYADSHLTFDEAEQRIQRNNGPFSSSDAPSRATSNDIAQFRSGENDPTVINDHERDDVAYEYVIKAGRPYLCSLPQMTHHTRNETIEQPSQESIEKELERATSRGWELLQEMHGKPCLFYTTGWWSYSFCYNGQVKQFHSLPAGVNGAPIWPPTEDPTTPTYVLGKFNEKKVSQTISAGDKTEDDAVRLQTHAETTHLVQQLDGGTECDLTGQDRKVEVQFHCNPQTTDRIGWIKETATCAYLMVIYTPRLCNDVAFLPPKATSAHAITCHEVLTTEEIEDWEQSKSQRTEQSTIEQSTKPRITVGEIEIGGMLHVGRDGKRIERGRVVMTAEEKAEVIAVQKNGQLQGLSKADLKKMDLNPEIVEEFRQEMKKIAGKKDWKIERLDDADGQIQLRGTVATDQKDSTDQKTTEEEKTDEKSSTTDEDVDGSYHEEL